MSRFRPPVRRAKHGFVLHLDRDEVDLLRRLLAELRGLLTEDPAGDDEEPDVAVRLATMTTRLFPPAHADDPEQEAEYQRLMRDELVTSRIAAIDTVDSMLGSSRPLAESEVIAFMQSVNALRLVLGTMLGVDDDGEPDDDGVDDTLRDAPEYHLYGYLSWLLEWTVRALAG